MLIADAIGAAVERGARAFLRMVGDVDPVPMVAGAVLCAWAVHAIAVRL